MTLHIRWRQMWLHLNVESLQFISLIDSGVARRGRDSGAVWRNPFYERFFKLLIFIVLIKAAEKGFEVDMLIIFFSNNKMAKICFCSLPYRQLRNDRKRMDSGR